MVPETSAWLQCCHTLCSRHVYQTERPFGIMIVSELLQQLEREAVSLLQDQIDDRQQLAGIIRKENASKEAELILQILILVYDAHCMDQERAKSKMRTAAAEANAKTIFQSMSLNDLDVSWNRGL